MPERRVTLDVNTCTPDDLSSLSEDEFRSVVEADLRRKSPKGIRLREDLSAALRSPTHVHRWHATLSRMQRSVDGQLGARECDLTAELARLDAEIFVLTDRVERGEVVRDTTGGGGVLSAAQVAEQVAKLRLRRITRRAEHSETRAGTLRFKTGLEETLIEARFYRERAMVDTFEGAAAMERNHLSQRCYRLSAAIERHRVAVQDDLHGDVPDEIDTELWQALPATTESTPQDRGCYETDAGQRPGPNRPGPDPERRELVGAAEA